MQYGGQGPSLQRSLAPGIWSGQGGARLHGLHVSGHRSNAGLGSESVCHCEQGIEDRPDLGDPVNLASAACAFGRILAETAKSSIEVGRRFPRSNERERRFSRADGKSLTFAQDSLGPLESRGFLART